jgi:hypothetical protein
VVARVFTAWRAVALREARNRSVCATFAAKWQRRREAAALDGWLEFVEWRSDARRRLARVLGGHRRSLTMDAWRVLSVLLTAGRDAELAAQLAELKALRAAHAVATREKSESFVRRWMHEAIFGALLTWRAWCTERSASRERIGRLLLHAEQRFVKAAFSEWLYNATHGRQREVVLARFASKLNNRAALAALSSWQAFIAERLYARQMLTRILARLMQSALGRFFHHWNQQLRLADEERERCALADARREGELSQRALKREHAIATIAKVSLLRL